MVYALSKGQETYRYYLLCGLRMKLDEPEDRSSSKTREEGQRISINISSRSSSLEALIVSLPARSEDLLFAKVRKPAG